MEVLQQLLYSAFLKFLYFLYTVIFETQSDVVSIICFTKTSLHILNKKIVHAAILPSSKKEKKSFEKQLDITKVFVNGVSTRLWYAEVVKK